MNTFSIYRTLPLIAVLALALPATAQNVFVSPESDKPDAATESSNLGSVQQAPQMVLSPPPVRAPATTPKVSPTSPPVLAPGAAVDPVLFENSTRLGVTPDKYREAELIMQQMAQQNPELRVNGFSMIRDAKAVKSVMPGLIQTVQQVCGAPQMQIILSTFTFLGKDKAIENFQKTGAGYIGSVVAEACKSSDLKNIIASDMPLMQIKNIPGTTTPGFSNESGALVYQDDFSKDEQPGFATSVIQLRRALVDGSRDVARQEKSSLRDGPSIGSMQEYIEKYDKDGRLKRKPDLTLPADPDKKSP